MPRELHSPLLDASREVVVVDAVRTAIGRSHPEKGAFRDTHAADLLEACLVALVERSGLDPSEVDDVITGCTAPFGEQSRNIARSAWLQAGYPPSVPGIQIDRRCGSAQSAVAYGTAMIASGTHELVIASGVEHMQHVPMPSVAETERLYGNAWTAKLTDRYDVKGQGWSAEEIALRWDISRTEMDQLAVTSHERAIRATEEGRFKNEIVPITTPHGVVDTDQGMRPGTSLETLAGLKTPFRENGRVTAGTSSQISDGAAAVLLASRATAERLGLRIRARIVDHVTVGVDPVLMLTGPIPATQKLLARTGLQIGDIDLFECNEAFASVVLAWARELGPDMDRVNVNGGAMAIGHPVGITGARMFGTILNELERTGGELGLVTMCCGGGQGTGSILQRL
ncbi:thiolase family protein [Paraconexibacter antarcticus]|uniref:Thiolase family protein n=1 Tax=Paraconexibacter antarcticus TaxID=2949664 RepID=A0ABY5DNK5_9ACTN|nr:thiolase family protein [Paraconexibacter antarcticus]UTI63603.1 thiolase family protein [Paraconexibacter antarcticus]